MFRFIPGHVKKCLPGSLGAKFFLLYRIGPKEICTDWARYEIFSFIPGRGLGRGFRAGPKNVCTGRIFFFLYQNRFITGQKKLYGLGFYTGPIKFLFGAGAGRTFNFFTEPGRGKTKCVWFAPDPGLEISTRTDV